MAAMPYAPCSRLLQSVNALTWRDDYRFAYLPNRQGRMNRERLKRLAVLLEGYRDSDVTRFDLQNWGKFESRRAGFLWLDQRSCNTAACAIFAEDGLS
jgi:hypothetical protein